MKDSPPSVQPEQVQSEKNQTEKALPQEASFQNKLLDYLALTKHRLLFLVLISTSLGFYLGSQGNINYLTLAYILLGVTCVGGGANALNQWHERDVDTLMERTKNRPLPSGRLSDNAALWFGIGISSFGFAFIAYTINFLTLILCFISWASYLFIYTPLKRVTILNTWIGTIPGALPAVLGWTAVTGSLDWGIATLFAILYFWQLAHFFAISWIYRDDYIKGGFKMLSWNDPEARMTANQILFNSVFLLMASINLFFTSDSGLIYLLCVLAIGLVFVFYGAKFFVDRSIACARKVFFISIIYLPLLFAALVIDRFFQ